MCMFSTYTNCGFTLFIYSLNTSSLVISYALGTLVGTRDIISRKPECYFYNQNDELDSSLYFCGVHVKEIIAKIIIQPMQMVFVAMKVYTRILEKSSY